MKAILKPRDSIAVGWAIRTPAIETVPAGMSPGNASTRSGAVEHGPDVVQCGIDTHAIDTVVSVRAGWERHALSASWLLGSTFIIITERN